MFGRALFERADYVLFRSSRPDSIETCPTSPKSSTRFRELFRSSRPDSIETLNNYFSPVIDGMRLFRSSRPDSIETFTCPDGLKWLPLIVPVF